MKQINIKQSDVELEYNSEQKFSWIFEIKTSQNFG